MLVAAVLGVVLALARVRETFCGLFAFSFCLVDNLIPKANEIFLLPKKEKTRKKQALGYSVYRCYMWPIR